MALEESYAAAMSLEEQTRTLLCEELLNRGAQTRIAEDLGVSATTVMRWKEGGEIPPPMIKLLRLRLLGEIPFGAVHNQADMESLLEFHPEEWRVIEILAKRAGQETGAWIRSQILSYLAFSQEALKHGFVPASSPVAGEVIHFPQHKEAGFWLDLKGGVAAGKPIDAVSEELIPVGKDYPEDHYALRVFGASMEPKIRDGSVIVVQRWQTDRGTPKKGTIVVYSDASGSTLKEFGYRKARSGEEADDMGNVRVLRSLNKASPNVQTMEGGRIDAIFVESL